MSSKMAAVDFNRIMQLISHLSLYRCNFCVYTIRVCVCVCVCVCVRARIGVGGGGGGGGGQGGTVPPPKKKIENEKFGQKQCEIRAKAMGNSGKSNGNSGKSNNFCPKCICRRFPSFLIAFAQIFPLLLPKFSHCFCPNFPFFPHEIRAKAMEKFGQKQLENSESGGIYFGQKLWKFWVISQIDILFSKFTS